MSAQQPRLFNENAYGDAQPANARVHAHRSDPATSFEAAARTSRSEKAALHRMIVLDLIRAFPSRTGHELWHEATDAQRTELETNVEIYRKANDLRHMGLVINGPARICAIRKTRMIVWIATERNG